jgi:threonine dehydratase
VSGGNHAQAVAYVARELGIHATIAMPRNTPANYLEATRGYGAEIVLAADIAEAFEIMARMEREGAISVHPFDDPLVVAGQATVGLEILEDLPNVTDIVVSIGGGGLAGGIGVAAKAANPAIRVWGVETEGADAMAKALAAGKPVPLPAITSIAKTLGAPQVTWLTLDLIQRYVESVTVVPDVEAVAALEFILERAKVMPEPAAACTLAAAERLKHNFSKDSQVVLVLCGGNTTLEAINSYPRANANRAG